MKVRQNRGGQRLTKIVRGAQWTNFAILGAALVAFTSVLFVAIPVGAQETAEAVAAADARKFGFLAAALSTGLAAVGAAYAVAHVGAASVGAISEKPELAGRTLIFMGLAEGIAIYGLILSVMILGRL
ncbi:MAG TPA: H+transporting two-sector ATPase C subunit [Deltaproteobacteria bacterium]|jgi:V/A-type H+-transporting ATPase subunit K|nr:H+transporting two-sector ATPase C subunit [Deltaproteobacteria bacterium]